MLRIIFQGLVEYDNVIYIRFGERFEQFQQVIDLPLDVNRIVFETHDGNVPLFTVSMADNNQFIPVGKFDGPLVEKRGAVY